MLLGILAEFIILDERDDHLLEYYAITPLQKSGYLGYRLLMPVIISFIFSFSWEYLPEIKLKVWPCQN